MTGRQNHGCDRYLRARALRKAEASDGDPRSSTANAVAICIHTCTSTCPRSRNFAPFATVNPRSSTATPPLSHRSRSSIMHYTVGVREQGDVTPHRMSSFFLHPTKPKIQYPISYEMPSFTCNVPTQDELNRQALADSGIGVQAPTDT